MNRRIEPPRPRVEEIAFLDPCSAFAAFARDPFAIFLDSALVDPRQGRFAFIAVDPFETIVSDGTGADPLARLEAALKRYPLTTVSGGPPFQGGACGLLSYDLCHRLERLPRAKPSERRMPELAVGLYDLIAAFDLTLRRAYLFSSGYPESEPGPRLRRAEQRAAALRARLGALASPEFEGESARNAPPAGIAEWRADCARARYEAKVACVVRYIEAGDIFQANLSRGLTAALPPGLHPFRLYERLRAVNPAPFAAYLGLGRSAILSSSPERFLKVSEGRVETRPIKGTRPRGENPEEDRLLAQALISSEKDRAENVMIVDLLRNDLSKVCRPGSVAVRELCVLESFASVHHLTSTVVGELEAGIGAVELLRAAFPGGSITGCPKVRAMEIIAELEESERGPHFGAIGYLGFNGAADLNIAIRTIAIADGRVDIRVGGGIVADSDPAEEYRETEVKAQALLRAAAFPDEARIVA